MDNEQLTSNLGELIKNQIEICEKLDNMERNFKKFKKSISPIIAFEVKQNIFDMVSKDIDFIKQESSNYDLKNIFGDPGEQLDKIIPNKYSLHDSFFVNPYLEAKYIRPNCRHIFVPKQAGDKVVNKVETPKQDQKYYLCIKDFHSIKEGIILKYEGINTMFYAEQYSYIAKCGFKENPIFKNIKEFPENFIPIQQFETLKEGQEIEFTLRNGKTYKGTAKVDYECCFLYIEGASNNSDPFTDLGQSEYEKKLRQKHGFGGGWPNSPTLEDLTKDLNTLITLPDLSVKQQDQTDLRKQANDLVDKFMPLVKDDFIQYACSRKEMQRNKAIKISIMHCDIIRAKAITASEICGLNDLKSELQKMLSE